MTQFPALSGFRGDAGLIRLIGHRGARGVMPENTMEGFEFTLSVGVKALEFDVVLTRDEVPVITHNHRLSQAATRGLDGRWLTGEEPKVASLSYAELLAFDVGGLDGKTPYGQRFSDQAFLNDVRVPSLRALLALCVEPQNSDVYLLLELKSDPELKDDQDARAQLVRAVIADVRKYNLEARTVLHSFDWALLDECRAQGPEMPTSYLSELPKTDDASGKVSSRAVGPDYANLPTSLPKAVVKAGGQMWCPHHADVSVELVSEAHDLGLLVSTWTVNDLIDIERVMDAGVDGIVSDYPGSVQHCLLNRNFRWQQ